MSPGLIVAAVVVLVLAWLALSYNRMLRLRNRVEAAWSQVDVQLRRRYDLIPNLVETVKGYAAHEKQTFESVTKARSMGIEAKSVPEQAQAENMLTQALRQVFAVAEAYPDLKANQNFLALQEELTSTEGKIAFSRQFYNDSVLRFNNAIQVFPNVLVAGTLGFSKKEFFEAEEDSRGPVKVDFSS